MDWMKTTVLAFALCLVAQSAFAGWNNCATGSALSDPAIGSVYDVNGRPIDTACYDSTATGLSAPLAVVGCSYLSVQLQPQLDGTGTGCTARIQRCVRGVDVDNCKVYRIDPEVDLLLDGVTYGLIGVEGMIGVRELIVDQVSNPSSHNCRVHVSASGCRESR